MTNKENKKRGSKIITPEIKDNFLKALVELSEVKPVKEQKGDTATSLIIMHRQLIQSLLDMGYTINQIVEHLANKGILHISGETLRRTLRTTDENGNPIPAKKRARKSKSTAAVNATQISVS